ncbi:MAG: HAD-IIA family hydrolase, partial [Ignavibacteria bacterium]
DVIIVTNKTTDTKEDYHNYLSSNGFNISLENIISSTEVIREYIIENFPSNKFFAIGEDKFIKSLDNHIVSYSDKPDEIDIVIVTLDRTLNFQKIEIAAKALERGAKFFAANIDDTCPVDNGEITDAGTVIPALEKRTGRKLEQHFGKPSQFMIDKILSRMKFPRNNYLLVGDRMQTDITMGKIMGVKTCLVKSGVKNKFTEYEFKPDFEVDSVYDLLSKTL